MTFTWQKSRGGTIPHDVASRHVRDIKFQALPMGEQPELCSDGLLNPHCHMSRLTGILISHSNNPGH